MAKCLRRGYININSDTLWTLLSMKNEIFQILPPHLLSSVKKGDGNDQKMKRRECFDQGRLVLVVIPFAIHR